MKDFVDTYAKAWEHHHVLLGQVSTTHLHIRINDWAKFLLLYLNITLKILPLFVKTLKKIYFYVSKSFQVTKKISPFC